MIDHYNRGGEGNDNTNPLIRPLGLTEQQKQDLIEFLKSLTDDQFITDTTFSNPWK